MLSLSLLGPFGIELSGKRLPAWRNTKAQALLAYVVAESALAPQAAIRRERLVELLWPDMPEESARQNLRQTLYLLRQELPEVPGTSGSELVPFVLSDRQHVRLNADAAYTSDVADFEQLLAEGSPQALEQAAALYRGPFLEDVYLDDSNEFEAWAARHRARWQRLALEALETVAGQALRAAAYERTQQLARRQLQLDPLREAAHRQLMEALARAGQRNAALVAYEQCRALLAAELGVEPTTETHALYKAIQNEEWQEETRPPVHHPSLVAHIHSPAAAPSLPHPLTAFFGRQAELAQIQQWLLGQSNRLVTLVGPGGSGKTRLAIEAGRALQKHFADGVHFVSLAEMESPELLATAVASALGVSLPPASQPARQLRHYLQHRELLLILDNVESAPLPAQVLSHWFKAAPGFRLLATSREPLNIYGESLLPVGGLDLPREVAGDTADLEKFSALALFVNRAQRARPDFRLTPENEPPVCRLCRLLQGNPLAIELAAPWMRMLPAATLEAELRRNLDLLAAAQHDMPPRHRSLRALFDYTWSRLQPEEQVVLQELAVFRADMSYEALANVTGLALPEMAGLVDKSLLSQEPGRRYVMHLHLRKYARERPQPQPERITAAHRRHAAYYAAYIEERVASLGGGQALATVQEITGEIENIRAAWRRAARLQEGALLLQMTVPLLLFYELRGWYEEGAERFEMAAEQYVPEEAAGDEPPPALVKAYLLATYGWFIHRLGHYEQTRAVLEESLRLNERLGDKRLQAFVLSALALVESRLGHAGRAETMAAASLPLAEQVADPLSKAFSLVNLGATSLFHGNYRMAYEIYEEALDAFRGFDNDYGAAICLVNLGHISMRLGVYDAAVAACEEARRYCTATGYRLGLGSMLRNLADTRLAQGKLAEAEQYALQARTVAEELGDREAAAWADLILGDIAEAAGDRLPAQRLFKQSNLVFADLNHTLGLAETVCRLSGLAADAGNYEQAAAQMAHSLSLYDLLGHDEGMARAHSFLGQIRLAQGAEEAAAEHFRQALAAGLEVELPPLKVALLYRSALFLLPADQGNAGPYIHLAATHPAAEYRLRAAAQAQLADLESQILKTFTSAGEMDLDGAMAALLGRLQGLTGPQTLPSS